MALDIQSTAALLCWADCPGWGFVRLQSRLHMSAVPMGVQPCRVARYPAWQAAGQISSADADWPVVVCTHSATFCYAQCARPSALSALPCRLDQKIQTQFPANVLSGFDDTMGSTYFNLNELQVGLNELQVGWY